MAKGGGAGWMDEIMSTAGEYMYNNINDDDNK